MFAEHVGLAMHVLRRLMPAMRDRGVDIDDARQQALLGLWHAVRNYSSDAGPFATYAAPCIRGYVLMAKRHWLRETLVADDEDGVALDSLSRSRDASPLDSAECSERAAAVHAALASLTPGDGDVMAALLMFDEGQHNVAQRLGVSRTRIQQRWNRALPRLRDALAVHGKRRTA